MTLAQTSDPDLVDWAWIARNVDDIADATRQHIELTVIAVAVGAAIATLLALAALRWRAVEQPVMALSGILYTIPSLAAFALLVPFFGFSLLTAEVALVSYTILILVRNIVAGVRSVPPDVREAAAGMGYTPRRAFLAVDLPIALPVILAGLRVATVTVVGLVTVTALLGMGGLGAFILRGFRRSIIFPTEVLVGTVGSVVLAAALDALLFGVQRLLTPWSRRAGAA